jgi:hypothetical protein
MEEYTPLINGENWEQFFVDWRIQQQEHFSDIKNRLSVNLQHTTY